LINQDPTAIDGAVDWLRAALEVKSPGSAVPLAELARTCPYDAALLYEAIGFLEREQRVSLGPDAVVVVRRT